MNCHTVHKRTGRGTIVLSLVWSQDWQHRDKQLFLVSLRRLTTQRRSPKTKFLHLLHQRKLHALSYLPLATVKQYSSCVGLFLIYHRLINFVPVSNVTNCGPSSYSKVRSDRIPSDWSIVCTPASKTVFSDRTQIDTDFDHLRGSTPKIPRTSFPAFDADVRD